MKCVPMVTVNSWETEYLPANGVGKKQLLFVKRCYVYMYCIYNTLLLFVITYCVFTCIPFRKLCYYSSKDAVFLYVFRLENSAVICQIYCVFTCIPFRKLCYYSSKYTVVTCTALTNGSYSSEVLVISKTQLLFIRRSELTCNALTELCC